MISYEQKLERVLKDSGNLHELSDILRLLDSGFMQHIVQDNTWVITTVTDYPRRRVMDVAYLVGDLSDPNELHSQFIEHARKYECSMVRTQGRFGWKKFAEANGWRIGATYAKDVQL